MSSQFPFLIQAADTVEAAVSGADVIVTATTAREPVIKREWISAGAHINAIGTFSPKAREIDAAEYVYRKASEQRCGTQVEL